MKSYKSITCIAAAVLAFSGVTASYPAALPVCAAEYPLPEGGTYGGNITWKYDEAAGTLRFSGTGAMKQPAKDARMPWYENLSLGCATKVEIADGVTGICDSAFAGGVRLSGIVLPVSVTSIGDHAFDSCSMREIDLGGSVTKIGKGAFCNCSELARIIIRNPECEIDPDAATICSGYESSAKEGKYTFRGVICGQPGSTAEAYAKQHGCRFMTIEEMPEDISCGKDPLNDTLMWDFDKETNTLRILGTGDLADYSAENPSPWSEYDSEIKKLILSEGLRSIGAQAFYHCTELEEAVIPQGVWAIGELAFGNCEKLKKVTIPSSAEEIGRQAFEGTGWLDAQLAENKYAIANDILFAVSPDLQKAEIPAGVEKIGTGAMSGCMALQSAVIPDSVQRISDEAFYGCENLTSVTIPDSLSAVGARAFAECTSLESITLPKALADIADEMFSGCTSLKKAALPDDMQTIGNGAFKGCQSLEQIVIPESVTQIGKRAFEDCSNLHAVTLPNELTRIADGTFLNCSMLKTLQLPQALESIGASAFSGCVLEEITLPETLQEIGNGAFSNCSALESITLPKSVQSVGAHAFARCEKLKEITFENPLCAIAPGRDTICSHEANEVSQAAYSGTIRGYEGSVAEAYANKWKYTFESLGKAEALLKGDFDGNGDVNVVDAQFALIFYTKSISGNSQIIGETQKTACDIDGDGKVSLEDAQLILSYYVKNLGVNPKIGWEKFLGK